MRRNIMVPLRKIGMLLLMGLFTLQFIHAQNMLGSTLPNGLPYPNKHNSGEEGNTITVGILAEDDYIFGFSTNDPSNVLVLNGIAVPSLNQGWFDDAGHHNPSVYNYIAGYSIFEGQFFRNFHAFDLSNLSGYGITPPITSAVLKVRQFTSNPNTDVKLWELFAVETPYGTINQSYPAGSPTGIAIYADLASGTPYGSIGVNRTLPGTTIVEVTLNSTAVSDINGSIGSTFVLGGQAITSLPPPVPVSDWAIILGVLLIGAFIVVRYRRRLA
ncbi:MAG: hypothetical protein L3J31_00495 [Bacteroidales bacterium]|nr:hypothetical protein [Bacteroidales bacterium]MCF6341268.1 hypothetical protein [Bacteroidales bacterium]